MEIKVSTFSRQLICFFLRKTTDRKHIPFLEINFSGNESQLENAEINFIIHTDITNNITGLYK